MPSTGCCWDYHLLQPGSPSFSAALSAAAWPILQIFPNATVIQGQVFGNIHVGSLTLEDAGSRDLYAQWPSRYCTAFTNAVK